MPNASPHRAAHLPCDWTTVHPCCSYIRRSPPAHPPSDSQDTPATPRPSRPPALRTLQSSNPATPAPPPMLGGGRPTPPAKSVSAKRICPTRLTTGPPPAITESPDPAAPT